MRELELIHLHPSACQKHTFFQVPSEAPSDGATRQGVRIVTAYESEIMQSSLFPSQCARHFRARSATIGALQCSGIRVNEVAQWNT